MPVWLFAEDGRQEGLRQLQEQMQKYQIGIPPGQRKDHRKRSGA
jgi:hypothetical protein